VQRLKLKHLALILALAVVVFLALETQREGLMHHGASPYNSRWDGSSNFAKHLSSFGSVEIVDDWVNMNLKNYVSYGCRIIFLISPEQSYSQSEISTIITLVKEKAFNLVIMDEGPYSNDLMKTLGLPVWIDAFRYVDVFRQRQGIAGATPGFIELGQAYYVLFSFVSPVSIGNTSNCKKIAYTIEGDTVGALCEIQKSFVLVIGDGSIAINALVPSPPTKNVYSEVIEGVVSLVCRGNRSVLSLIDASKYNLRVLTFSELIEEGYSGIESLMLTLNPFRHLYPYLQGKELYLLPSFSITIIIFFAAATAHISRKRRLEISEEISSKIFIVFPGYSRTAVEVLVNLCRSHDKCVKEVPCILKKINDKCVKQISSYMSRDRDFRRKILEKVLLS